MSRGPTPSPSFADVRCESVVWTTGQPCTHRARYLWPFGDLLVCGTHARALLHCIPLDETVNL